MNLRDKNQIPVDLVALETIIPRSPMQNKDAGIELFFKSGRSMAVWYSDVNAWREDMSALRNYFSNGSQKTVVVK